MPAAYIGFVDNHGIMRLWENKRFLKKLLVLTGAALIVCIMFQVKKIHDDNKKGDTKQLFTAHEQHNDEKDVKTFSTKMDTKDTKEAKEEHRQVSNNVRSGPWPSKMFSGLGVKHFSKLNITQPHIKSSRYLLPLLFFDMGPNNLYRLFRQGVVTAYEMGRTIVVPVFHRHPRMGDRAENPFDVQIYDQNYTVDLVWSPNETIDTDALMEVLGVISMKEFHKNCNGRLDALVQCGYLKERRVREFANFQRAANLMIDKTITIDSYEKLVTNDLNAGTIGPDNYKCLGILYGKGCLPDVDRWLGTFSKIAKSFLRPMPCRNFASRFIENVMGGEPYMAVHWRFDTDWLDMCKHTRPSVSRKNNKEICRFVISLMYDEDTQHRFIGTIRSKMAEYKLKQVFLATPPNNLDLIRLMRKNFPGKFYYSDDLVQYGREAEGETFWTNNYSGSLIEQEICFRSTIFIGSSLSSWTQTVLTDRLARGIKRHDSVLHALGGGETLFPSLEFQFPEGKKTQIKQTKF